MRFEVQKKHANGWKNLNIYDAPDSAKAAGQAGFCHGPGTYRVRPEDSKDKYIAYKVGVNKG